MTMNLDLFVYVSEGTLASWSAGDMVRLSRSIYVEVAECQCNMSVHFFQKRADLIEVLDNDTFAKDRSAVIVVSDFLTVRTDDRYVESDLARKIDNLFRNQSRCCGLIALADSEISERSVVDAAIDCRPWSIDIVRAKLEHIVNRLWLKTPPEKQGSADAISVVRVSSLSQLRECLKLRASIYTKLGYLPPEVCNAASQVEIDGYDPVAIHFAAIDSNHPDSIVGVARLIVPGIPSITMDDDLDGLKRVYPQWFDQIACEEETPIWRERLENPPPNSLPIFDSFQYFEQITDQQVFFRDSITPAECCELSRILVRPAYRGRGISSLLVARAIDEASALRRQYMLLECAPHHETMYSKYGFKTIQDADTKYYAKAQRLDTYAVAMRRELEAEHGTLAVVAEATTICGQHEFFVGDGPAHGCSLSTTSASLNSTELADSFDEPITALHGNSGFGKRLNDPGPGWVSRSHSASLRGLLLAALKSGSMDDFLQVLRLVVGDLDITSIRLTNQEGSTFTLTRQQLDYKPAITLEDRLGSWLGASHG